MHRTRTRMTLTGVVLFLALLASACGGGAAPSAPSGGGSSPANTSAPATGSSGGGAAPVSLTLGYTAVGDEFGDLFVAHDLGLFQKYGLNVDLQLLNSSSQIVAALANNSVQIAGGDATSLAAGMLKGVDFQIVSLTVPYYSLEIWGKQGIKSFKDLKGKTLGLSQPNSLSDHATSDLLKANGMTRSDLKIVYLGGIPSMVAGLESGAVDVTMIIPPQGTQLRDKGFALVGDTSTLPHASTAYAVTSAFAKAHPEAISGFIKADAEAVSLLRTQPDKVLPVLTTWSGVKGADLNQYAYNFYKKLWQIDPKIDMNLIQTSVNEAIAASGKPATVDISKFVNPSYLKAIEDSGFIRKLPQ